MAILKYNDVVAKYNGSVIDTHIVATGGTITTDGDYKIHTFTSSGTFTVTSPGIAQALIVGGGGNGGQTGTTSGDNDGGGGGFVFDEMMMLQPDVYDVSVAENIAWSVNQGGVTVFNGYEASGGFSAQTNGDGGDSASGFDGNGNGGAGHTGDAIYPHYDFASGGPGYISNISGASIGYAGGGGLVAWQVNPGDDPWTYLGKDGGGNGDQTNRTDLTYVYGTSARANSGAGGGGWLSIGPNPGAHLHYGGSGIVIIRYKYQ